MTKMRHPANAAHCSAVVSTDQVTGLSEALIKWSSELRNSVTLQNMSINKNLHQFENMLLLKNLQFFTQFTQYCQNKVLIIILFRKTLLVYVNYCPRVLCSTVIDLYGIAHVKLNFIPHQKMLERCVLTTGYVRCVPNSKERNFRKFIN